MSLEYPYRVYSAGRPLPWLGGRTTRPKPRIWVTIIGPAGTVLRECLVDPGADDTVFPEDVAAALGIDLSNAPSGNAVGIGQTPLLIRYAVVTLRIATSTERREWQGWVGFVPGPTRQPLLGFAGFLQYFTAEFDGENERLALTVNGKYPGT